MTKFMVPITQAAAVVLAIMCILVFCSIIIL